MITQSYLKSILNYNLETGTFTWRVSNNRKIKVGSVAGTLAKDGYLKIGINSKLYYSHRLAWLYVYGTLPLKMIDHINGIKTDNKIQNLRQVTHSENQQNQRHAKSNNKSKHLGVGFNKRANKFIAQIQVDNKQHFLGYFNTPEEAHAVYLKAKRELHKFCTI